MEVQWVVMVVQKAERKGRKRGVGRGRRRVAREVERRCWGRGRSVWKMPVGGGWVRFLLGVFWGEGGRGEGTEEEAFPDFEEVEGGEGGVGGEICL
jgi:hypothetical protein